MQPSGSYFTNFSLLGNAVKFTENGHILVKSQVEELPRNLSGRLFKVIITVEDTVNIVVVISLISGNWDLAR